MAARTLDQPEMKLSLDSTSSFSAAPQAALQNQLNSFNTKSIPFVTGTHLGLD
jgi:hypothetical protein